MTTLSLTGKRWHLARHAWREGAALAQSSGLPPVVAGILAHRGYLEAAMAENFLNPRFEHLPAPATLKDMDAATARLAAAIRAGECIGIFGDYDVDGTCATAILTHYLRSLGAEPALYIPDRLAEGYGPNVEAMRAIKAMGVSLLVTVDTGISAHEPLAEAARLGMDVIVTDHHPQHGALPPAAAVVNPNRADDTSALQTLCGSGVVFYVLMALNRRLRDEGFFTAARPEPRLSQWLDLVALATVCDVMKLTGPNRLLVSKGLAQLSTWRHRGLAALAQVAGVKDAPTASTFGFALGPRLNAAGRIDSARAALDLLLAADDATAAPLAAKLDHLNRARREIEQAAVHDAMAMAESHLNDTDVALVLANPAWHPGVVGLVASRVKERTGRPVFAFGGSEDQPGKLKGSGRGVEGLDLGAAVAAANAHLLSGGGHAMAAGATLEAGNLDAFRVALNVHLRQQLAAQPGYDATLPLAETLAPTLHLDATALPASLTPQLAQTLNQLAPFGNGNPEPMLALEKVQIAYARPVGATQEHLKLRLTSLAGGPGNSSGIDAIAFGAMNTPLGPALTGKTPLKGPLTLAGHLRLNRFQRSEKTDFQITDAHCAFSVSE